MEPLPETPIKDFIEKYRSSTGYIYRSGVLDFFDFISGKRQRGKRGATNTDMIAYERIAVDYLTQEKKAAADVIRYVKHLDESGVLPKTAHVRIVATKEFLSSNGIDLDPRTLKDIRTRKPKGGRQTDFSYIDKKILSELLHHGDARFKAFVLVLASSGIRLGECLALTWSNVKTPDRTKYPDKPSSVFIRKSKTGHPRTVYITRECEVALAEWQKVYSSYRDFATKRSQNLKVSDKVKRNDDTRVFPFTETSCYAMWDHALKCAGYFNRDEQTRRVQMNIHRLRNFFSVQVASASNSQVSELLLGHTDNYGGAYTGRSDEQIEQEYRKAEPALTIGTILPELQQQKAEIESLKVQLAAMKARDDVIAGFDAEEYTPEDIQKAISILKVMQKAKIQ